MSCPRCAADELETRGGSASQCRRCHLVFDVSLLPVAAWQGAIALAHGETRTIAPHPEGVTATLSHGAPSSAYRGQTAGDELALTFDVSWRAASAYTLRYSLLTTLALFAASLVCFFVRGRTGITSPELGLLCALSGLVMLYHLVAIALNHTRIEVSPTRISVRQGPVPWWGNRDVDARTLEAVFCDTTAEIKGIGPFHHVSARLRSGRAVRLASSLRLVEQAQFIEREAGRLVGPVAMGAVYPTRL